MGIPFPAGLQALAGTSPEAVEWAWTLNASASVTGSVAAMVIAICFGLNTTLACGAAAYLLAMLMAGTLDSGQS